MLRARLFVLLLVCWLLAAPVRATMEAIPYRVVSGDTAHRIASRHGLRLDELRALNEEVNLDRLRVGQTLSVGRGYVHTHRVRVRETLATIAERFRVSPRSIARWNGLTGRRLRVGQELRIFSDRETPPSRSIGRADRGRLVDGVTVPPHAGYVVRARERAYMADTALDALLAGFDALVDADPDAPRLEIRDASRRGGGPLDRHRSHQSGRDVDISLYRARCSNAVCAQRTLRPSELDADRLWRLVSRWLEVDAVEYVFLDHALQEPLYEAARRAGVARGRLATWFQWPRGAEVRVGTIRHVPRHADHMHVRFRCAAADEGCGTLAGSDGDDAD